MRKNGKLHVLVVLALAVVLTMGMHIVAAAEESAASSESATLELTLEDAIRLAFENGSTVKTAKLDESWRRSLSWNSEHRAMRMLPLRRCKPEKRRTRMLRKLSQMP